MKQVVIFASGRGSNAAALMAYFQHHHSIRIGAVFSNQASAGVHAVAHSYEIPSFVISQKELQDPDFEPAAVCGFSIDLIVLAGFLLLIPETLIRRYPQRIINIHPSLLPAHGGKGMYGKHVHEAVLAAGDHESGISIHYVNSEFDKGEIIAHFSCPVLSGDRVEDLSARVLELEHKHLAPVIEQVLL